MTRIYNRSFRAEDALGRPIAGAQVTLWDAKTGGTQLTTGIQDLAGADIAAGILTTDAWGYVPDFQDTADRAAIWAIGSATGSIDGVERVLLEPSDTDDRVTTLETQVADLQGRANVVLYAYDYGFRPDGNPATAAANTTAVANALAALGSAGGTVVLPPGRAYVTSPGGGAPAITLPTSRCGLRGAGHYATVLVLASGANCHMIANHVSSDGVSDPNAMMCEISDLALDGAGAYQTGTGPYYGIYISTNPAGSAGGADISYDATHRITNVYTRNTFSEGIYHDGRSDTVIRDCKVSFAGANAYTIRYDTHLIGCVAEKSSRTGFDIIGSNAMLVNCKAYACGQDSSAYNGQAAVPNSGHGYVVVGGGIGEVQLVNCDAQQVSGHGFWLQSGSLGTVISGCSVGGASMSNGTGFVSYNIETSGAVVQGSSLAYTGVSGVRLAAGADANDVTITHTSLAGQAAGPALSADTVALSNRVYVNGLPAVDVKAGSRKITGLAFGSAATDAAAFGQAFPVAWAPNTSYAAGQLISYLGFVYKATAPFTSGSTFSLASKVLVSAPFSATWIPSGQYVFAGGGQLTGTANSLGVGTLRVYPFYLPHAATLTRIGAEVTASGDVGSKFRVGIYGDTGSFVPGGLLLDAGQIAGDSATVQELTISLALTPGVYWVGGVVQAVTTTQPTMRTFTPGPFALPTSSAPGAAGASSGWGHSTAVSGALPAAFVPGASPVGSVPRIHLKA